MFIKCNFAICNLLLILQSLPPPPHQVNRRRLSTEPCEFKRSLVWLNLPCLAKLGIPRAGRSLTDC